jgi:hypothetical protein
MNRSSCRNEKIFFEHENEYAYEYEQDTSEILEIAGRFG